MKRRPWLSIEFEGKRVAFHAALRIKRGGMTYREAAKDAETDVATYFRAERGYIPDVVTGRYRCIAYRNYLELDAQTFTSLKGVRKWVSEWLKNIA